MSGPGLPALLIPGGVSALLLALSLWQRKKQRLLADLPTSKADGVFIGLVELCGTAESAAPLRSFLSERDCVCYSYDVQEHWSRTVTETYTDKDGKPKVRTRHESGWTTVAHGDELQPFYLQDDTGAVLIRPAGAQLEPIVVFDQTVSPLDNLYYQKGPTGAVADSDHRRRFLERAIPVHTKLYVVGQARERDDVVAPEIAASKEAPMFLVSTRAEKSVQRGHAVWSWVWWVLGLAAAVVAGVFLVDVAGAWTNAQRVGCIAATVGGYLLLWGATWTWMVFNSLISLRQRVRQAWSLIDVQLKRRHDLIPALTSTVSALSSHESTVQGTVATLRAQSVATRVGQPGPDFTGIAPGIHAVIERYPELVAQPAFARLHQELVTTEQRIALARAYYNDIATQFATRLERVPEGWVGQLTGMKPEPLLAAANFERANVTIDLTPSAAA